MFNASHFEFSQNASRYLFPSFFVNPQHPEDKEAANPDPNRKSTIFEETHQNRREKHPLHMSVIWNQTNLRHIGSTENNRNRN